jgi:glycerophosphoryl diester phosphodiesterase
MTPAPQTLIFAHRGANREAAENTRSAFDAALKYPIDGMETDVQLTLDEVAVLWHDRSLDKLGLPGQHIDDFAYAALRAMNFAAHFAPPLEPEGVMSLQAFLDAYRTRCRLLIEIKNRAWESAARQQIKVRQTLDRLGQPDNDALIVSSFHLESLIYAHGLRPEFPLIYNLETDQTPGDAAAALAGHPWLTGLCLPIATLDEAMMQLLRGQGKSIIVYTCNSDAEISKALEMGVDILISDLPQKALALRNVHRNKQPHERA